MKKIVRFLIIGLFFIFPFSISAKNTDTVKFSDCVDGDTAKFILNDEEIKVRFLAIDTPETKHPTKGEEPYGKEASNYTCNKLKKAKKIVLEYDPNSNKLDKYNRYLAWVFVDDSLLQEELVSKGLAKVAYLYGDYKYTSNLEKKQEKAKKNKLGIWSDYEESFNIETFIKNLDFKYKLIITVIIILIIIVYLSLDKKRREKAIRKGKSKLKREIKKAINKKMKDL